ncbi:hypothetical protein SF83666_b53270 (plasmid) [Sinorhizobium fredii CCBAU 83666]|nr:hypothetical protein SF83666_b53270 [Sinorhizobium fredii CCBAU 83666]
MLSERMVVEIDQYAALSAATATRNPELTRLCVSARFELIDRSVCSAAKAEEFVRMLVMTKWRMLKNDRCRHDAKPA